MKSPDEAPTTVPLSVLTVAKEKNGAKDGKDSDKENTKKRKDTKIEAKTGKTKEGPENDGSNNGSTKKGPATARPSLSKKKGEADDAFTSKIMTCFVLSNGKKHEVELAHASELKRHNEVMEVIALRDQALKQRQSDFDFKLKRLEQYANLKTKFQLEFIDSVFPEFKDFVDANRMLPSK